MKLYLMELDFLQQLLSDRKELFAVARSFGTAKEMREARQQLFDSVPSINVTPKNDEEASKSYSLDEDGIAHIPIVGELTPHAETDVCGAYTANALTEYGFIVSATQAAEKDGRVKSITYEVNSPGGYADGLTPAVDAIRTVSKPTMAHVDGMAASAAYWLASQTDKIVAASRAATFGSIGVAVEELDNTEMLKNAGITRRVYTSTDAPDKRPDTSTKEGQQKIIDRIDDLHNVFVQYVSEGRGVSVKDIKENYGKGGVLIAEKALNAGMIDEIDSVPSRREETISGVVGKNKPASEKAEKTEVPMDKEKLMQEHPAVYNAIAAEAKEAGVQEERARVNELHSYIEADPDNLKLAEVVNQAVADGSTANQVNAKIQVAIRDGGKLDGENPPDVETTQGADALTDEDRQAAALVGMSLEEYKQYKKKEA